MSTGILIFESLIVDTSLWPQGVHTQLPYQRTSLDQEGVVNP
jgi:hypothetical protein